MCHLLLSSFFSVRVSLWRELMVILLYYCCSSPYCWISLFTKPRKKDETRTLTVYCLSFLVVRFLQYHLFDSEVRWGHSSFLSDYCKKIYHTKQTLCSLARFVILRIILLYPPHYYIVRYSYIHSRASNAQSYKTKELFYCTVS